MIYLRSDTVLGPLLVLIYINDMSLIFPETRIYQYANSTVLSVSANSQLEAKELIDQDFKNLGNWCNMNKLTINTKKN